MTVGLNIWDFKSRREYGKEVAATLLWKRAPAIYRYENEKCTFQTQDNRSNANDQTPFGRPFPRSVPQSAILHLAIRGRLNVPGIFEKNYSIDLHELYACNPVCR